MHCLEAEEDVFKTRLFHARLWRDILFAINWFHWTEAEKNTESCENSSKGYKNKFNEDMFQGLVKIRFDL